MKLIFITVFLFCCILAQDKKETIFGKTYVYRISSEVNSDNGIQYFTKCYFSNNKLKFCMSYKGVRNDSTLMTTKIRMLPNRIICTEIYKKNAVFEDSIVWVKIFKNGEYERHECYGYKNGKVISSLR